MHSERRQSGWRRAATVGALLGLLAACSRAPDHASSATAASVAQLPWDGVVTRARGATVTWVMWRGDPSINSFIDGWVAPRLKARYDITLNPVDGQGAAILNDLVVQRDAKGRGTASLVWINGETFANLRHERLLDGPWASHLPNAAYVDSASSIIMHDFEQDPAGYESPWGTVQLALVYDSTRTPSPPPSLDELGRWIDTHPGRFTHDQAFTGLSFLKVLLYANGGGVAGFKGGFNDSLYQHASDGAFRWLEAHRKNFWHHGDAYPAGVADLHRLFANGEVDLTMSMNQNEVVTKVRQGIFPASAHALLLHDGSLANAHYLGIPFNAPEPAAAMVVANLLLSPEAQLEKQRPEVWADGTVLARGRLPAEWAEKFANQQRDARSLAPDSLAKYAVPEVNPRYSERLLADWQRRIRGTAP
jgi:putative spermidine/putrescine transport system substrate-binding protein